MTHERRPGAPKALSPEVRSTEGCPVSAAAATGQALPGYAELLAQSNFSFQHGASHPEELVVRARALGYQALALTDECAVAGVVRAHAQAEQSGLTLLPGAVFCLLYTSRWV